MSDNDHCDDGDSRCSPQANGGEDERHAEVFEMFKDETGNWGSEKGSNASDKCEHSLKQ